LKYSSFNLNINEVLFVKGEEYRLLELIPVPTTPLSMIMPSISVPSLNPSTNADDSLQEDNSSPNILLIVIIVLAVLIALIILAIFVIFIYKKFYKSSETKDVEDGTSGESVNESDLTKKKTAEDA